MANRQALLRVVVLGHSMLLAVALATVHLLTLTHCDSHQPATVTHLLTLAVVLLLLLLLLLVVLLLLLVILRL
jgi:hypothetical protein